MAVVRLAAYNRRVEDAETITGWGNDGGGGGVSTEPDIVYQGTFAASRKVGTSRIGRYWDDTTAAGTSSVDMTIETGSTWIAKVQATNPAALLTRTSPALSVKIGQSDTVAYEYYLAGNDNYPAKGGWIIIGIDPNVSGYRDNTLGSPTLTNVDAYGIMGDFSAGSKAENLVIDAIDIGVGLNLVGGDGGDDDGTFTDFLDYDEGTLGNRFGYATSNEGIIFINGKLTIGEETGSASSSIATVFQDTGRVVVWNNGYFSSGYASLKINIANSTTDVDMTSCTFIGRGETNNTVGLNYTSSEDTRPDLVVTGSAGTFDLTTSNLQNFRNIILQSGSTVDGSSIECTLLEQSSSVITDSVITVSASSQVSTMPSASFDLLTSTEFVQAGEGHAITISETGTKTLSGLTFTGFGDDFTDSASLFIASATGEVTLSIVANGGTPTYTSSGADVLINNPVVFTLTGIESGSEVRILSGGVELAGQESIDTGEDFVYQYNYPGFTQIVDIVIHALEWEYQLIEGVSLTNNDASIPIQQTFDRNYLNP